MNDLTITDLCGDTLTITADGGAPELNFSAVENNRESTVFVSRADAKKLRKHLKRFLKETA